MLFYNYNSHLDIIHKERGKEREAREQESEKREKKKPNQIFRLLNALLRHFYQIATASVVHTYTQQMYVLVRKQ